MPISQIEQIISEKFPFLNTNMLYSRLQWSIRLRWLAIAGFFGVSLILRSLFKPDLPYNNIWFLLAMLGLINLIYIAQIKFSKELGFREEIAFLHLHIIIDVIILTFLIHFSGGVENPMYFFYIFHIVLSSILFHPKKAFSFTTFIVFLFLGAIVLEYFKILPHYSLFDINIYQKKLALVLIILVFTVSMYTTTYICTTFMQIYRQSKRIINEQYTQLLKQEKEKAQFFRYASHELKSPIIAIKTSLDVILKTYKERLPSEALGLIERAVKRAGQMLSIIQELLQLTRAGDAIPVDEKNLLDVSDILVQVIEAEQTLASSKNILLEKRISASSVQLWGREEDFKAIFQNLIGNAVRYTPEGGRVTVILEKEANDIIFIVEDTGIGIDESDLKNIFKEFYRSENARQMVNYGTGLGLSLVKQLLDRYNGTIKVSSRLGRGTQFYIKIPCT